MLLVIDGSSPDADESARVTFFQGLGHTVTTIQDSDSQANYDTAVGTADLAYVPETIASGQLGSKLREAPIGVVSEVLQLDSEFGFSTTDGAVQSGSSITITDNSHGLTKDFAVGSVSITASNQPLIVVQGTPAPGARTLATVSSAPAMVLVEPGGQLATTYNGSDLATSWRVRLPIGDAGFSWSSLNANGLEIVQDAIDWAEDGAVGDLVLHFKLDETSGSTATDSSANANDGSFINSATPGAAGPGVSGGVAASLTGSGDRVLVPDNTAYDLTDAITVSAWVNFDQAVADQTSQQSLVSRFTWSGKKGFQLFTDQPSSNSLRFRLLNGSWKDAVWTNPDVDAGGWHHVVGSYDGATIRLYVDGELKASKNQTNALAAHTGADLSLGANLDGRLADVRIYNRTLSASEIAEMNGLIAHWKLDASTGTNAADSSPYGHDATLTGGQSWTTGSDSGGHESDYTDGTDDYFTAPTSTVLDDAHESNYTVMAYFKPNSVPPGSGSNNNASYGILIKEGNHVGLHYNASQQFQIDHLNAGNSWHGIGTYSNTYPPGAFYHVAGVVDYDAGTIKIYVDGVLAGTETFTPGSSPQDYGSVRWRLGIAAPGSSTWRWPADGVIDDARIYSRALSGDEIAQYATTGMIGHWKLDETSGTTAVDSGPSGADGTYQNGVALDQGGPYPGVTAPAFDGSNDHVELPAINAKFQSGLTIAAWIRPDATLGAGQWHEIFEISNGSSTDQVLLSYSGNAGLQLYLTDTVDGSSVRTIEDNTSFTAGRWVHCVATIDESGYGKIYRNGQVTKSGFFTSFPTSVSRGTATIGKSSFGDHFGGGLYDVRLYNYELSAAEIHELYGLVGKWDFDEGSGATIAESTGAASDASFNTGTPSWVDGVRGFALEFDGTNDATTDDVFDPPAVGTVAFWFRCNTTPATTQRLLGLGNDWEVLTGSSGRIAVNLTNGSTGSFKTEDGVAQADRWLHLVASYDTVTGGTQLHLDGVLVSTDTRGLTAQNAATLAFGTRNGSTQRFNGALDDVRVYKRWLSTEEIAELYGLVGWWRMEETSGSTVADSSGAGNDGTVIGTAGWSTASKEAAGAIELDGTNYVEIPGVPVEGNSVSIAGWAKLGSADSNGSELISLGNYFAIRLDDGYYGTSAFAHTGSGFDFTGVGYNLADAGWRHIAAVFDGDNLELRLYVDGVLRSTDSASGPVTLSGWGTNTRLGEHGDSDTDRSFSGLMDDVRVYNRAISRAEIRTLFYGEYTPGLRIVKWVEVPNP